MDINKISATETEQERANKNKKVDALFSQLEGMAVNKINRLEATNCYLERRLARLEAVLLSSEQKAAKSNSTAAKKAAVPREAVQQLASTPTTLTTEDKVSPVQEENRQTEPVEPKDAVKAAEQPVKQAEQISAKQRLNLWLKAYPAAFDITAPKPLKIGIHKDLQQAEDLTEKLVKRVLANYVKLPRYFSCIKAGADRLDLKGEVCGQVTAEEEAFAQEQLKRLNQLNKKRQNARHKAQAASQVTNQPNNKAANSTSDEGASRPAKDANKTKKQTGRNPAHKPRPNRSKPSANKQNHRQKKPQQNKNTNRVANTGMQEQLQKLLG